MDFISVDFDSVTIVVNCIMIENLLLYYLIITTLNYF